MASTINASTTQGVQFSGDTSGALALQTNNGVTAVTIDTSQNVGIGTSSPSFKLEVVSPDASTYDLTVNGGRSNSYCGSILFKNSYWSNGAYGAASIRGYDSGVSGGYLIFSTTTNGGGTTGTPTERMRIDSSGNVGIGVTPSAWSVGGKVLEVGYSGGNAGIFQNGTDDWWFSSNSYYNGTAWTYNKTSTASQYHMFNGCHIWLNAPSGTAGTTSTFTERMRIDSSGNVLVGTTTSPTYSILTANTTTGGRWEYGPSFGAARFNVIPAGAATGVYITSTGNSWTAISDERFKENLKPIENAAEKVSTLRAVTGNYIADETKTSQAFLIAQDVQKVLPEAVDESNPDKLGLSYTDTIPLLVAAIQELTQQVSGLKAELDTVKSELSALKGTA